MLSAGIVTGSSEMGLSLEEFEALSPEEREEQCRRTEEKFLAAGADRVYRTLNELAESLYPPRLSGYDGQRTGL